MRRASLVLLGALVLSPLAGAAGSVGLTLPTRVTGVAADGGRVAIAVAAARHNDCYHVVIWSRLGRRVQRLGRPAPCGPATSTGRGLLGPTLAGPRALWITYVGGNIREWSLWTASATNTTPRLVAFVARDVDAAFPIVLGEGDSDKGGYILPYAVDDTVYSLRVDGTRGFSWKAPERVIALAAKNGELAVALASGPVVILDTGGNVLRTEPFATPADAVAITGHGLLVQHGHVLELRGGLVPQTWTISGAWHLVDDVGSYAVYVRGREIHVLDVDNSKDVVARRTTGTPFAQFESTGGLVYASGRHVAVLRTADVVRLVRASR